MNTSDETSANETNISSSLEENGCYYSDTYYPHQSNICLGTTSFGCYYGRWSAQASCGTNDTPVNWDVRELNPNTTSVYIGGKDADPDSNAVCYYNNQKYTQGSDICFDGTRYNCFSGSWAASGSCSTLGSAFNSDTESNDTDLCSGDGDGPLIISSQDSKASVKVCGRNADLIRYWYKGARLISDEIRDGTYLNDNDIKFPGAPNSSELPIPPFAVRYGNDRDMVRIYTPPKAEKPAMVTIEERRSLSSLQFGWLGIDRLEVAGTIFIYNSGKNAFVPENGSTRTVIPIGR